MTTLQMSCGDLLNVINKVLTYMEEIRKDPELRVRDLESLDLAETKARDLKQLCEFGTVFASSVHLSSDDFSWICMYINKDKRDRAKANPRVYAE